MTTRESKRFGPSVRKPNLASNAPKKKLAKPGPKQPATTAQEAKAAKFKDVNVTWSCQSED